MNSIVRARVHDGSPSVDAALASILKKPRVFSCETPATLYEQQADFEDLDPF